MESKVKSANKGQDASHLVVADAQTKNRILASKTWTWTEIRRGDCTIDAGATFILFSDGSTNWTCNISSTDSGDEWDGRFRITNASGVVLFDTAPYHFDISESNVKKRWNENRGPNGQFAQAFNEAHGNGFSCSC
jgi:hypothetical protein